MSSFKKIPKEKWDKLSPEDREYHTFEFNKSVERRKRITIISTRIIAILCIFVLFYIGYVQLEAVKNYQEKIDKYGTQGYCYLCGEYTLKKCECQYYNFGILKDQVLAPNITKISLETAEYNTGKCLSYDNYQELKINEFINKSNDSINFLN